MISITDIEGIRVGHASDFGAVTGCTVILFDKPAIGAIDLRGGGTSTRQIDSLLSHNTFGKVHAILLTGGSAYGLDASGGGWGLSSFSVRPDFEIWASLLLTRDDASS